VGILSLQRVPPAGRATCRTWPPAGRDHLQDVPPAGRATCRTCHLQDVPPAV